MTTATRGPRRASKPEKRQAPNATFDVLESKLHVPATRPGIVKRDAIVDRLDASTEPVIAVVAPPGYGKTTVLSQLASRRGDRVGWISVDETDNDPVVLLSYVVEAVDRVEHVDSVALRAQAVAGSSVEAARSVASAIAAMERPMTLVIDNFESVTNWESRDVIAALAMHMPTGSQLAISSRDELALPVALLRARRGLFEFGRDDLAMDATDAAVVLERAGAELSDDEICDLVAHTEGWPAGLYLAALAARATGPVEQGHETFAGDDRFMGDYLRSEFLARLSTDEVEFLTRVSILDRMCGPLCDAVTGAQGSSFTLDQLGRRNLLVLPLDRRYEWYRFHRLLRELLLAELRRREPHEVPDLHRRAAAWHEDNGQPEVAIAHAQAAGDDERVARLVLQIANSVWASGRGETVMRWMEWFEANNLLERHPSIAVHGALMYALTGRPAATERWAEAAERTDWHGTLADGNTMDATLAYLRALLCRDGIETMRHDAELAGAGLDAASPYRATMLHVTGLSYLLEGDAERADAEFADAVESASLTGSVPAIPVMLAERGVAAIEREDWNATDGFVEQMLVITQGGQFNEYWTSALVFALAARVLIRRGDLARGREFVARAARLRPLLSYALPVVSVQALLELGRSYVLLGDQGGARAVLRQANDILRHRPRLGVLPELATQLRSDVDTIETTPSTVSSLTTAELKLLPFLPTHLSFREIADRLYVSRHTVKSQAMSIYRKLGVSSRSEAIERVHEQGLLDHRS